MAMLLGVISPKINIRNVIAAIDAPRPLFPKIPVASTEAELEAKMFTIMFPMSMEIKSLVGLSRRRATSFEFDLFSSWSRFTLILLRLKSAVSEPEKKADRIKRTASIKIWSKIFVRTTSSF